MPEDDEEREKKGAEITEWLIEQYELTGVDDDMRFLIADAEREEREVCSDTPRF